MQLKGEIVYSGSQFKSVVYRGGESTWLDLEAAGHMTSAARKKTIVMACWCSAPFLSSCGLGFQPENFCLNYCYQNNHPRAYPCPVSKVTLISVRLRTCITAYGRFSTELLIADMNIKTRMRYYLPWKSPTIEMWKPGIPVLCWYECKIICHGSVWRLLLWKFRYIYHRIQQPHFGVNTQKNWKQDLQSNILITVFIAIP